MRQDGAPMGLYGAALLCFAVGGVVCGVLAVDAVRQIQRIDERQIFEVPGQYFVEAPVAGRYDALHVPEEAQPSTAPLTAQLSFRLVDEEAGVEVPGVFGKDPDAWTYEINGKPMRPLVAFDVQRPGRYRLDVEGRGPDPVRARVVFGHDLEGAVDASFTSLLWAVLAGLVAFFLATPLFLIGLLTHLKRRRLTTAGVTAARA